MCGGGGQGRPNLLSGTHSPMYARDPITPRPLRAPVGDWAASRSTKRSTHARLGIHMQQCLAVTELPVRIMGSVMQAMYKLSNFTFLSVAGPCFVGQNL